MEYLTKVEAEERLRFASDDAKFCPDCLTELKKSETSLYCPNEMCLNDEYEET